MGIRLSFEKVFCAQCSQAGNSISRLRICVIAFGRFDDTLHSLLGEVTSDASLEDLAFSGDLREREALISTVGEHLHAHGKAWLMSAFGFIDQVAFLDLTS